MCTAETNGFLAEALSTGVDDIVTVPHDADAHIARLMSRQLVFTVEKALAHRREGSVGSGQKLGRMICVLGLKGGGGKTLTSANLAASLADAGHSQVSYGEEGYSTLERVWARPTAEINGMWGGHTGPGGKTIVPREAHAKLSFRLVAHQEPAEVAGKLRDFAALHSPPGLDIVVTVDGPGVRPSFSPIDSPAVAAGRRAMERAFGQEILFTREGGSGPEADLADILGAPLVFIAVGLDDDRIHAPNERVDMKLLLKGAQTAAYLWDELAALG